MTGNVKMLALELLDRFDEHTSAQLLLLGHYRDSRVPYFRGAGGPKRFTGLHEVAFLVTKEIHSFYSIRHKGMER